MKNFRNWKTTLAGVSFAVASLAKVFGYISVDELTGILGILAGFGFFFSKDKDSSDDSKQTKPETQADDFIGKVPPDR